MKNYWCRILFCEAPLIQIWVIKERGRVEEREKSYKTPPIPANLKVFSFACLASFACWDTIWHFMALLVKHFISKCTP